MNKYNVNWDGLTEKNFKDAIKNGVNDGELIGIVRIGEVCFELIYRVVGSDEGGHIICGDYYVYGIDTNYATAKDGTPYADYIGFTLNWCYLKTLSYTKFKQVIKDTIIFEIECSTDEVKEKAKKPLLKW